MPGSHRISICGGLYSTLCSKACSSNVKTATVIGFPMGYSTLGAKISETQKAIIDGADELDAVINLIALKSGDWSYLEKEMQPLVELIHEKGKIIKVIVESGVLTRDELIRCCEL